MAVADLPCVQSSQHGSLGSMVLRYSGKQWPKKLHLLDGFVFLPSTICPAFELHFVRATGLNGAEPAVVARFFADGCRFPWNASTLEALLWKDGDWRCPLPVEKARLGVPADVIKAIRAPPHTEAAQASFIATAGHVPSCAFLLCQILQCSKLIPSPVAPRCSIAMDEQQLRQCVVGTVFQPGIVESFPGTITAPELAVAVVSRCREHGLQFGS